MSIRYIYISSYWKCDSVALDSGWLITQWYAWSCYVLVSHDLHRIGTVTKARTGIIQHPRHIRHQLFIHAYTSLREAYMTLAAIPCFFNDISFILEGLGYVWFSVEFMCFFEAGVSGSCEDLYPFISMICISQIWFALYGLHLPCVYVFVLYSFYRMHNATKKINLKWYLSMTLVLHRSIAQNV